MIIFRWSSDLLPLRWKSRWIWCWSFASLQRLVHGSRGERVVGSVIRSKFGLTPKLWDTKLGTQLVYSRSLSVTRKNFGDNQIDQYSIVFHVWNSHSHIAVNYSVITSLVHGNSGSHFCVVRCWTWGVGKGTNVFEPRKYKGKQIISCLL